MKNAFCTLYDRCLYGCSIDLLYGRSFIFYQSRLVVVFSSEPNLVVLARSQTCSLGLSWNSFSSSFTKLSVQISKPF